MNSGLKITTKHQDQSSFAMEGTRPASDSPLLAANHAFPHTYMPTQAYAEPARSLDEDCLKREREQIQKRGWI